MQNSIGSLNNKQQKKYSYEEGDCSYCDQKIILEKFEDHLQGCSQFQNQKYEELKKAKNQNEEQKIIQQLEQQFLSINSTSIQNQKQEENKQNEDEQQDIKINNQGQQITKDEEEEEQEDNEDDWEDEEYSEEDENENNGIGTLNELNNLKRKICKLCDMLLEYQYEDQLEEHLHFMHKVKLQDYKKDKNKYMTDQMTLEEMEERQFELDWEKITEKRKISDNIINQLHVEKHETAIKKYKDLQGELSRCCICMCEYEQNDNLIIPPCEHVFHKECLKNWLNRIGECPKCKQQIELLLQAQNTQN